MGRRRKMEYHSFYCIECGSKGLDIPRKTGLQKEKFHKKKLFCFNCNKEVNHIECRNDSEVFEFKNNFEEGVYINE